MTSEHAKKIRELLTRAENILGKKRLSADEKEYAAHLVSRAQEILPADCTCSWHQVDPNCPYRDDRFHELLKAE